MPSSVQELSGPRLLNNCDAWEWVELSGGGLRGQHNIPGTVPEASEGTCILLLPIRFRLAT